MIKGETKQFDFQPMLACSILPRPEEPGEY